MNAFVALDWVHVALLSALAVLLAILFQLRSALQGLSSASTLAGPASVLGKGPGSPLSAAALLDYLLVVGRLKRQRRTGWTYYRIPAPESVAEHMYRLGMMGMAVQDPTLDRDRIALVGMVHDLAEALVGDITPHCRVSKEEKQRREEAAVQQICDGLAASPRLQADLRALWNNYEYANTPEGRLVKQMDKMEMLVQAFEYETLHQVNLDEFFQSTMHAFSHPEMVALHAELLRRRAAAGVHGFTRPPRQVPEVPTYLAPAAASVTASTASAAASAAPSTPLREQ